MKDIFDVCYLIKNKKTKKVVRMKVKINLEAVGQKKQYDQQRLCNNKINPTAILNEQ